MISRRARPTYTRGSGVLSDTYRNLPRYLHARVISGRGNSNYRRDELRPETLPTLNLVLLSDVAPKNISRLRKINPRWRSSFFCARYPALVHRIKRAESLSKIARLILNSLSRVLSFGTCTRVSDLYHSRIPPR